MVVQSPLEYPATWMPMEPRAVLAIVGRNCGSRSESSRCRWGRGNAASFAGQWSERCKSAATPLQGMRPFFTNTVTKRNGRQLVV